MTLELFLIAMIVGALASLAGGAVGGILVGGKHLGGQLAAIIGAFYGPLAGIPGVALGLVIVLLGFSAGLI